MSESLLAKVDPDISLEKHLFDVATTTEKILYENGFDKDLRKAGWIAGLYHDLGKANQQWQDNVRDNSHPNHSALSGLLTSSILNEDSEFIFDLPREMKCGLILAILHHHSPWTNSNMKTGNINPKKSYFESAVANIKSHLGSVSVPFDNVESLDFSVQFNFNTIDIDYELLSTAVKQLRDKVAGKHDKVMEFGFHIYSALRQADWHESSKVNGGDISPIPSSFDSSDISGSFDTLRPFQSKIKKVADSSSIIGLAGCGEGKTYSAIIWGKKQREKGNISRMVFAMPTQTTTNNLYDKVKEFSSESQCSIYHSSVEVFKQNIEEDMEDDMDKINSNKAELYQAGFNITTVDHVLDTFVSNFDTSPIAYDNLLRSGIVFDEIHAYDEDMIGNIIECIQLCERLDIPYYVMSATIPNQIQNQINAEERVVSTGNLEEENNERSPFEITVKAEFLDSNTAVRDIDQSADKVMIVKNTVREAQNLAKRLREDPRFDVYYYSSEFTQVDRKEKEKEITTKFKSGVVSDKTRVLVCTQICEISLDLSSDQLLTDIAPIDAILQRAGRIHRDGIEPNAELCNCKDCQNKNTSFSYNVTVYDTTDEDEPIYPYSQDTDTKSFKLLEDSARVLKNFGVYKFSKSLKATTKAYQNYQFNFKENSFNTEHCTVTNYFTNRSTRINFRNIVNRKITIFPSEYINSSNTTRTPKSLFRSRLKPWTFCLTISTRTPKSLFRSFRTTDSISKKDVLTFIELYSIEVPVYWINSDDYILSREGSLVKRIPSAIYDIKYSYKDGINSPRKRNETSSGRPHKTL